jgi:hypothetical protein
MTEHAKTWAWVWGDEPPAFSIGYEAEKLNATDSGFRCSIPTLPTPTS